MYKDRHVTVIIAAGGAGSRFGAAEPKQFLPVDGKTMLSKSVEPFVAGGFADLIVVTAPEEYMQYCCDLFVLELGAMWAQAGGSEHKLRMIKGGREVMIYVAPGGGDRPGSVRAGLDEAEAAGVPSDGLVLIHDAARPFVTRKLIEDVLEAAHEYGAAVPAVPIRDTVYVTGEDGFAEESIGRELLRAAQTPQGFVFSLIKEAHGLACETGFFITDEGMPVLQSGQPVRLVTGDPENIKITTRDDLSLQKMLPPGRGLRVGAGFDAHRFCEGRPLIIGGIEIPFDRGLAGHSDADVLTHALMDAILGALREGDIGRMFPDTDPKYAGAYSVTMLGEVASLMHRRGYDVVNADLTIVTEQPRIGPYRERIEQCLAEALGTAPENISVKATTTEKLGFTGREEGIAAEAIVLIQTKTDRRNRIKGGQEQ